MKKYLSILMAVAIATLFVSCTKNEEPEDDDEVISFTLNVTNIADNQATITVDLTEGTNHGGMIIEGMKNADVDVNLESENQLIKYVRQNGVNIDFPYTHTLTGLKTETEMFTAVIVFKSNGLAVTPQYKIWTAEGAYDWWSEGSEAGSLDENEWEL